VRTHPNIAKYAKAFAARRALNGTEKKVGSNHLLDKFEIFSIHPAPTTRKISRKKRRRPCATQTKTTYMHPTIQCEIIGEKINNKSPSKTQNGPSGRVAVRSGSYAITNNGDKICVHKRRKDSDKPENIRRSPVFEHANIQSREQQPRPRPCVRPCAFRYQEPPSPKAQKSNEKARGADTHNK
jgi:hypothetical protein